MSYDFIATVEMIFAIVAFTLGMVIVVRARENRLSLMWGLLVVVTSLVLVEADFRLMLNPKTYDFGIILRVDSMCKWFVMAQVYSFIPLVALDDRRKLFLRIVLCLLPFTFFCGVVSMAFWSGLFTRELYSWNELYCYLSEPGVQLRIILFLGSLIAPQVCFLLSFMEIRRQKQRIPTRKFYYYTVLTQLAAIGYVSWIVCPAPYTSMFYVLSCTLLPVVFSVFFLLAENPFSFPPVLSSFPDSNGQEANRKLCDSESDFIDDRLFFDTDSKKGLKCSFAKLDRQLWEDKQFCKPSFDVEDIVRKFNVSDSELVSVVKAGGFMSTREYIASLRVRYFKQIATENPHQTVAHLAELSGFPTRMTFYRNYTAIELTTPNEFLKQLREKASESRSGKSEF